MGATEADTLPLDWQWLCTDNRWFLYNPEQQQQNEQQSKSMQTAGSNGSGDDYMFRRLVFGRLPKKKIARFEFNTIINSLDWLDGLTHWLIGILQRERAGIVIDYWQAATSWANKPTLQHSWVCPWATWQNATQASSGVLMNSFSLFTDAVWCWLCACPQWINGLLKHYQNTTRILPEYWEQLQRADNGRQTRCVSTITGYMIIHLN